MLSDITATYHAVIPKHTTQVILRIFKGHIVEFIVNTNTLTICPTIILLYIQNIISMFQNVTGDFGQKMIVFKI